jgi:hypothetical protein
MTELLRTEKDEVLRIGMSDVLDPSASSPKADLQPGSRAR